VSFAWDFGDGGSGSGVRTTHAFGSGGTFVVTLTVTNDSGGAASASQSVTVASGAPTASFSAANGALSDPVHTVIFDGTASSGVGGATIVSWSWDFGDSSATGSGSVVKHTYAAAGTVVVTLTVTDSLGRTGSKAKAVLVP